MNDIAIAYPIKDNPTHAEDWLLRYSLRSLQHYAVDYGQVFMVGKRRKWFSDMIRVADIKPADQRAKFAKVTEKMCTFCEMGIPFVLMNDDFILLEHQDITEMKWKALPSMKAIIENHSSHSYRQMMRDTKLFFGDEKDVPAFVTHTPMLIDQPQNVDKMRKILKTRYTTYGFSFRQAHAMVRGLTKHMFTEIVQNDVKMLQPLKRDKWPSAFAGMECVSFHPNAVDIELFEALKVMFPEKSIYEI